MRQNIRDFAKIVASTLNLKDPIYEFGSFQVPGQEGLTDLRPLFPEKKYVGCDMREGRGVDKILNMQNIDLPSDSVDTVLSFDTLEHVEYPVKAMEEVYRILKPGGIAIISSVMNFRIHDHPYDYWRFTPEAFRTILKPFPNCWVGAAGKTDFPHTIVGMGFKGDIPDLTEFQEAFKIWKANQEPNKNKRGLKKTLKLLVPPILLKIAK